MPTLKRHLDDLLFRPVDASSLVFFRVAFGLIMLIETYRFFDNGWITDRLIEPDFMFKYYGFEWIEPLTGSGMYWAFVLMGFAAFGIMIGAAYRIATTVLFLIFSYVFLLDMALYLNHFYLVILIAFLFIFVPANRSWAVDAWMPPRIRSDTVPGWAIWVFRLQMEVVLLYAGIVKLNPDWLRLEPMGMWLAQRSDIPLVGQYFTEGWAVALASYGSIAMHLIGAPLLLFRRTRGYVIAIYCVFHLMNVVVFDIGIFPWITIAATLIFLEPDWPKQAIRKMQEWQAAGMAEGADVWRRVTQNNAKDDWLTSPRTRVTVLSLMGIWFAFQILFPLRHVLYPGYVSWTEEGHNFSWQMMLRSKDVDTVFLTRDPATQSVDPVDLREYLTGRQVRKMVQRPELMRQFAHYLADRGAEGLEVWVRACVSLNGRKEAWLIDPLRDLAKVERSLRPADWILPLENPPARPPIPTGRETLTCRLPSGSLDR